MRGRITLVLVLVILAASHAIAQDVEPRPPEVTKQETSPADRFDVMLGDWEGGGTVKMTPDAPAVPWTCKNTFKRILDGHFVQEDVRIEFEGGQVPTLFYRSFYGWDAENEEFVAYDIGNNGEITVFDHVGFTGRNTLVMLRSSSTEKGPIITRTTAAFGSDRCEFRVETAAGTNEFKTSIEGVLERGGGGYAISERDMQDAVAPAARDMSKLKGMCGHYVMSGEMTMQPGQPATQISAREDITSIFGGTMIHMDVFGAEVGDSGFAYRGVAFLGWNPKAECYEEIWFNNMGESGSQRMYWVNDRELVIPTAQRSRGQATANRTVLKLDEAGAIETVVMQSMTGNQAPRDTFIGKYEKVDIKVKDL